MTCRKKIDKIIETLARGITKPYTVDLFEARGSIHLFKKNNCECLGH